MDKEKATEFVVQKLGRSVSKNEIIRQLCEETGMDWAESTKFIQYVEANHTKEITLKQSPLVVLLSGIVIFAGLVLAGMTVLRTLEGYIIFFLRLPIPYLGNLFYTGIGIAMIVGGSKGLSDTFKKLFGS